MLDITYVYTAFSRYLPNKSSRSYPLTTRVMTKILNNQKKLNVIYSDIPLLAILTYLKYKSTYEIFYKNFRKDAIKTINTKHVLLTLGTSYDLLFGVDLLNSGFKVIVGGSLTKIYNIKELRKIFKTNGCNNLDNLIIVRPYINKDVDLYEIIINNKDIGMEYKYDISDIYNSDEDFYLNYIPYLKKYNYDFTIVSSFFNSICTWSNCNFCTYKQKDCQVNFMNMNNVYKIAESTKKIMNKYDTNCNCILDPDFQFNEISETYLKLMSDDGYKVGIMTSIRSLKDNTYFDRIFNNEKDFFAIYIGIETLDNFALGLLNKGSDVNDSIKIFDKIIKRKNKNILVHCLLMLNLASKNKEHIIEGYNKLAEIRLKFLRAGIQLEILPIDLELYPEIEYSNNKFFKLLTPPDKIPCLYERYDINGKKILFDKQIVDKKIFKFVNYYRK